MSMTPQEMSSHKRSCNGCVYQIACSFYRAIECLTNDYSLRKEKEDEETIGGEAPEREMAGETSG